MYKVTTFNESNGNPTTHQHIEGWEEWGLDKTFIEFKQKGGLLIIPKRLILVIYKFPLD